MSERKKGKGLSPKEVAAYLGLNVETVHKMLRSGSIRAGRTQQNGGPWVIHPSAVDEWMGVAQGTTERELGA